MRILVAMIAHGHRQNLLDYSAPRASRWAGWYNSSAFMWQCLLVFSLALVGLGTVNVGTSGDEKVAKLAPVKELAPFATKHCISCHDKKTLKGGFDMETLLTDPTVDKNPAAWQSVLERIVARDMPPKNRKDRPTEAEYRQSEDWLRGQIQAHEAFAAAQRPRPMRRLNRDEYNRTIQQIFGLSGFSPADSFPPDDGVEGFT
ncbi:MAG TPA: DUF1587 domain-containing protein, partial [Gemmata sp.]|nr:DUF1587 domain-containing protein [Gemmata sp.]